jgi:hypothetical protein
VFGIHSVHGVLFDEAGPTIPLVNYPFDNLKLTGNVGAGLVHFIDMLSPYAARNFLAATDLGDTTWSQGGAGAASWWEHAQFYYGWQGCARSFDRRLIVDRADDVVTIYADGVDVTSDYDAGVQDIKCPILCGPLQMYSGDPIPVLEYVR